MESGRADAAAAHGPASAAAAATAATVTAAAIVAAAAAATAATAATTSIALAGTVHAAAPSPSATCLADIRRRREVIATASITGDGTRFVAAPPEFRDRFTERLHANDWPAVAHCKDGTATRREAYGAREAYTAHLLPATIMESTTCASNAAAAHSVCQ